jgi:hypothetical protein
VAYPFWESWQSETVVGLTDSTTGPAFNESANFVRSNRDLFCQAEKKATAVLVSRRNEIHEMQRFFRKFSEFHERHAQCLREWNSGKRLPPSDAKSVGGEPRDNREVGVSCLSF